MKSYNVRPLAKDNELVNLYKLNKGDIVFRDGKKAIAKVLNTNMTHSGIYLGDGIVHDLYSSGIRYVTVSEFLSEANNPHTLKAFRFISKFDKLIINALIYNINNGYYLLPSDTKPWNILSSANDYKTASCIEYCYSQYKYAITSLITNETIDKNTRSSINDLYYSNELDDIHILDNISIKISQRMFQYAQLFFNKQKFDNNVYDNRWENDVIRHKIWNIISFNSFINSRYFELVNQR